MSKISWLNKDKTLRRWDLRDAVLRETFPVGDAQIRHAKVFLDVGVLLGDWSFACRCLASPSTPAASVIAGDEKGQIHIWDTQSGTVRKRMSGHKV